MSYSFLFTNLPIDYANLFHFSYYLSYFINTFSNWDYSLLLYKECNYFSFYFRISKRNCFVTNCWLLFAYFYNSFSDKPNLSISVYILSISTFFLWFWILIENDFYKLFSYFYYSSYCFEFSLIKSYPITLLSRCSLFSGFFCTILDILIGFRFC